GNPDLVVTNYSSSKLSLLLGNGANKGSGQFQKAQDVPLGGPNHPWGIVSGDFNGDHIPDVAVADNDSDGAISILISNGKNNVNGQFKETQTIPVKRLTGSPVSVATGDFNHDNILDLAVTNSVRFADNNYVSVLLGKGDGTFQDPKLILIEGHGTSGIVVGDLNRDGYDDIAVTNNYFSNSITVLLNRGNGEGTFKDPVNYDVAPYSKGPNGIALVPTNTPGRPDLIVTCTDSATVNVFFNKGDGTFYPAINIPPTVRDGGGAFDGPTAITVADFAGNGLRQAAIANYGNSNNVVLLSPTGVGNTATFLPGTSTPSTPLNGPTDLGKTLDTGALDTLLKQMAALQGGKTVSFGPCDRRDLITPPEEHPSQLHGFHQPDVS